MTATATLQTYVSQLRKHVGTSTLLTTPNGYRLDVPCTHLDGARFEATLHEAAQAHERNAALVAERLCDALQLWRGPPFGEFAHREWAVAERRRLEEICIAAREDIADHQTLDSEWFGNALADEGTDHGGGDAEISEGLRRHA